VQYPHFVYPSTNAGSRAWRQKSNDKNYRSVGRNVSQPYVVYEKNRKVLYVQVMRVIYEMLEAALLWYKKFQGELEQILFKFNPFDPCVANCTEKGSQHTLLFHVVDRKSSDKDPKVNDQSKK
jgi:hypothetical protein